MEGSSHRWITPEGKEIKANHFWGLIYKYCLFWARTRIINNSEKYIS